MSAPHISPSPRLDEAYARKLDAALRADDPRRVAELVSAHAREAGAPARPEQRRPTPAGTRVRRLVRAFDAHTIRAFNPPAPSRGGWSGGRAAG